MATIQNSNSSDEKGSHNEQCGVPSSSTGTSQTLMDPDQSNKPSAISPNMWQKFQALQKKRQELTRKVPEGRQRKNPKHKIDLGQATNPTSSDQGDDLSSQTISGGSTQKRKLTNDACSTLKSKTEGNSSNEEVVTEWQSIKPYLGVNDHLKGVDRGRHAPKTKLEERIDDAVAEGDFEKAEMLSDSLATRDFGKNIADAIDAKRYSDKKQKEEEAVKAKKKKKLFWGFDHKERWETKGNM